MKKSLTLKMFILIAVSLIAVLSLIVLMQNVFFGEYYESIKIDLTVDRLNEFWDDYIEDDWTVE